MIISVISLTHPCLFSKLSYSPASSRQVYDMTMT